MRKLVGVLVCLAMMSAAGLAFGQTKTVTGEKKTISGTVEAIQADTREVTVKGAKGNYVTFVAPPEAKKFAEMKVGDTITATYYDNIVLRVKQPGEKDVDTAKDAVTPSASKKPGATSASQRTITATITEIDPKIPSITFTGPNNWKYSSKVADKKALAQVKVGDKVDITWTEAVLISVQAPTKK
jgi:hypothetical protein